MKRRALVRAVLLVPLVVAGVVRAEDKVRSPGDARLAALAKTNLHSFAEEVARLEGSELGKTRAIVAWLAKNFDYLPTDYKQRTLQQIVERGGGNCFEMAQVATACLKELKIPIRQIHEVNINQEKPERGVSAKAMVKDKGKAMSVFGRHHNDHMWIEIHDGKTNAWYPADPTMGVVGTEAWLAARVGFGKRYSLNPSSERMIVPIAIAAADDKGAFTISRTQHYLIDGLDQLYGGKLAKLPAWPRWTALLRELDPKVQGAFAGQVDLHQYEAQIDELAKVYESLSKSQAQTASRAAR